MMKKNGAIFVSLFSMILFSSPVMAAEKCEKLLTTTCLGCHGSEKFCPNLGKTAKYWNSMLKLMISNGADIPDDDFAVLKECLSKPSNEAKGVCSK